MVGSIRYFAIINTSKNLLDYVTLDVPFCLEREKLVNVVVIWF